jgi:hypothetical protein
LKFGSEAWVLKKRDKQRLEAAQMKFLRHLLRITKLDRERNQTIREKLGLQNTVLGNKTILTSRAVESAHKTSDSESSIFKTPTPL